MEGTLDYISIIKKHEAIYNIFHPDYKNFDAKSRAWREVAEEVGLTIEACKRKWKNLRDSYTKYLRSFRTGTKSSRKYQYWAHAHHMDFLKPFQGPSRHANGRNMFENLDNQMYKDEVECDLGFEVLDKFTPPDCSTSAMESPKTEEDQQEQEQEQEDEQNVKREPSPPPSDALGPPQNPPLKTTIKMGNGVNPSIVRKRTSTITSSEAQPSKKQVRPKANIDVSAVVQANRDVDAMSLFFLSLAKSVVTMPKKQQAIVKMRCMKAVSEAEIHIEASGYVPPAVASLEVDSTGSDDAKAGENGNENSEHFLYCMSPSRVEAMIDISSDDEWNLNSNGN